MQYSDLVVNGIITQSHFYPILNVNLIKQLFNFYRIHRVVCVPSVPRHLSFCVSLKHSSSAVYRLYYLLLVEHIRVTLQNSGDVLQDEVSSVEVQICCSSYSEEPGFNVMLGGLLVHSSPTLTIFRTAANSISVWTQHSKHLRLTTVSLGMVLGVCTVQ